MTPAVQANQPVASPTSNDSTALMFDGSEVFPYLWRYFLSHPPLRDWLMRAPPYASAAVAPRHVAQGIAFCCNFSVPDKWADMSASFDLGEMFIPDHAYSHFMCGTVVAASSFHKHLVCALGPAASRNPACLPSYRTCVRRMVVDMGSSRSINIMEFSWMEDGALIVTTKILVPPDPSVPYQAAGCTGAFALFTDVRPGGLVPSVPRSLVSFVEAPRCPFCSAKGSLGCYCSEPALERWSSKGENLSSAVWPPTIPNDVTTTAIDSYHSIRSRLDLIQHIAHVKVTAHVVTTQEVTMPFGPSSKTYKLGPSRFVVKSVLFRPSTGFESDTLRQVADKLRLLRAGSLSLTSNLQRYNRSSPSPKGKSPQLTSFDADCQSHTGVTPTADTLCATISALPTSDPSTHNTAATAVVSSETSGVSIACDTCGSGLTNESGTCQACSANVSALAPTPLQTTRAVPKDDPESEQDPEHDIELPENRLLCPLCSKTFSQQGSLNRHLKNIHEARKIPCQYCSMSFGQMFDLKVCLCFDVVHANVGIRAITVNFYAKFCENPTHLLASQRLTFLVNVFILFLGLSPSCFLDFQQRHQKRKHADKYTSTIKRERIDTRFLRVAVERT